MRLKNYQIIGIIFGKKKTECSQLKMFGFRRHLGDNDIWWNWGFIVKFTCTRGRNRRKICLVFYRWKFSEMLQIPNHQTLSSYIFSVLHSFKNHACMHVVSLTFYCAWLLSKYDSLITPTKAWIMVLHNTHAKA